MPEFQHCSTCHAPDICARGEGCATEMLAQLDAIEKLAAFGAKVLVLSRQDGGCDIDGGEVQELAAAAGVLEERQMTQPCSDSCACALYGSFPTNCFFIPDNVRTYLETLT